MPTSTRVTQGSRSKGSLAYEINSEGISGSNISYGNEFFAQGSDLKHWEQTGTRLMHFMRGNISNSLFVDNNKISDTQFDDNLSPESPVMRNYISYFAHWGANMVGNSLLGALQVSDQGLVNASTRITLRDGNVNSPVGVALEPGDKVWFETAEGRLVFTVTQFHDADDVSIKVQGDPVLSTANSALTANDEVIDAGVLKVIRTRYYMGSSGQVHESINHVIEKRDLGQTELFDKDPIFREVHSPDDPISIINTPPEILLLPITMVDPSSDASLDGVLEPFNSRSLIDASNTEIPFKTKGIRCSIGDEDAVRRSIIMQEGVNAKSPSAAPFLDALEYFGTVELPPVFYEDNTAIHPFSDTKNYQEVYFTEKSKKGVSVESTMINAIQSGSFDTTDALEFDFYGSAGIDYFETETDSIAFGGLKK